MKKARKVLALVIVLMMVLSSAAFSASASTQLQLGWMEPVTIGDYTLSYDFIPDEDGYYAFYSESYDEYGDPYAELCDSEGNCIDYCDDYVMDDYDFRIVAELTAGETYTLYVGAYVYEDEVCETNICVEKVEVPVSAEIYTYPEDTEVVEDYEWYTSNLYGLEILYTFEDGSEYLWSYEWDDYSVNGATINVYDEFSDDFSTYYVVIECGGTYVYVGYDVVENPVEKIEYVGDPIECVFEYSGYYEEDDNGDFYFYYQWDLQDDGDFKVTLKDGSTAYYYEDELCEELDYPLSTYSDQYREHWTLGENEAYAELLGAECTIPVMVIENPVESIEITKDPDMTVYEGRYYPIWDGAEITVNLTDGSKVSAVVNDDNIWYSEDDYGDIVYYVDVDGYVVEIYMMLDYETEEEYYELWCLGSYTDYYGFEFIDSREVVDMTVDNFNWFYDDIIVNVEYETGETEEYIIGWDNILFSNSTFDMGYGFVKTQNGIAWYGISDDYVYDEDNDYLAGYWFWFHGYDVYIDVADVVEPPLYDEYICGDADFNGTVNIKDATAIQKATAALIELSDIGEYLADVDGNYEVNVKDATAIQKWLAGMDTDLPIGDYVW